MQMFGVGVDAVGAQIDGQVAEQMGDNEAKQYETGDGHEKFTPDGTAEQIFQRHGTDIL
jgi:hypothetical protein